MGKSTAALFLLSLLTLFCSTVVFAECSLSEATRTYELNDPGGLTKNEGPVITLENSRIVVEVAPEGGGNIMRFADKAKTRNPFHRLDDNFSNTGQWKALPYTYCIDERGPKRAAVTFIGGGTLTPSDRPGQPKPESTDLKIERTMSIDGDSTRLRVDVTITNVGAKTVPDFRYMVHSLYSYKVLPGANVYAYAPVDGKIQLFDHERIVKGNYLASIATDKHPFKRWSFPGEMVYKGRYSAEGWLAMYCDSGYSYLFYDPAQFDYVSFWSGTHPAEWLVLEPTTKGIELKPGQSTSFSYSLACDARDMPFKGRTLVNDPPMAPAEAVQGTTVPFAVRITTVRDTPEPVKVTFTVKQKKRTVLEQVVTGEAKPFLYKDLSASATLPATLKAGKYSWTATDADGTKLGSGTIEVITATEADKRAKARAIAGKDDGVFPTATWANNIGMQFVRIPAGEFLMGSAKDDPQAQPDELPQHKVRITRAFMMAKYEVTIEQFQKFAPGHRNFADPYHHLLKIDTNGEGMPVIISHNTLAADDFIKWLNENDKTKPAGWEYRLPTEAEWEYAARGPQNFRYPWGNSWDSSRCLFGDQHLAFDNRTPAADGKDPIITIKAVGSYSPQGDSPFGVCDMAGGVWEWCMDFYDPEFYRHSPVNDPVNLPEVKDNIYGEGSERVKHVLRGGSWTSIAADCRATYRYVPGSTHNPTIGIRVVLAPVRK